MGRCYVCLRPPLTPPNHDIPHAPTLPSSSPFFSGEGSGPSPQEDHANMTRALEMLAVGSRSIPSAEESEFTRLRKQQVSDFVLSIGHGSPASSCSCFFFKSRRFAIFPSAF